MLAAVRALPNLVEGSILLDVASGPGEPALTLARALPHLAVVSPDALPDMVAQAQARAAAGALPNVRCAVADMTDMSAFADGSVDAITCCYGLMFPADKAKAMAELHRVLKPGGSLVATHWLQLDLVELGRAVMGAALGLDQPPPLPPHADPLSLRAPGALQALASGAGFTVQAAVESSYPFDLGRDEDEQFAMAVLLFRKQLDGLDAGAHARARAAFARDAHKFAVRGEGGATLLVPGNVFVMTRLLKQ